MFLIKPFLVFALFAFCAGAAGADTITWTGNTNTDWDTGTNWSGEAKPTLDDTVIIPNAVNSPKITGGVTAICNRLTIEETRSVTLAGGSLTVNDIITVNGTLQCEEGTTGSQLRVGRDLTVMETGTVDMSEDSETRFFDFAGFIDNKNSSQALKFDKVIITRSCMLIRNQIRIYSALKIGENGNFTAAASTEVILGYKHSGIATTIENNSSDPDKTVTFGKLSIVELKRCVLKMKMQVDKISMGYAFFTLDNSAVVNARTIELEDDLGELNINADCTINVSGEFNTQAKLILNNGSTCTINITGNTGKFEQSAGAISGTGNLTIITNEAPVKIAAPIDITGSLKIRMPLYIENLDLPVSITTTGNQEYDGDDLGTITLNNNTSFKGGEIVFNVDKIESQNKSLTVEAAKLRIRKIETHNGNISLKVDELTGTQSINAGSGIFQLSPKTLGKTIAYADDPSDLTADVKYSSNWDITAASFTVGDNNAGNITIENVGGQFNSRPSVKFITKDTAAVTFTGGFYGRNLEIESGRVIFNTNTYDTRMVALENDWKVNTVHGTALTGTGTVHIEAGNIEFSGVQGGNAIYRLNDNDNVGIKLTHSMGKTLTINGGVSNLRRFEELNRMPGNTVILKGAITTTGNISFENNVKLENDSLTEFTFTSTDGDITFVGNVDAGSKDVSFITAVDKRIIVQAESYELVTRTITGKNITFTGKLIDNKNGYDIGGTTLTINATGVLRLGNVEMDSLTCGASGAAVTFVGTGSSSGTNITVRSTSSLVFNTDLILTNTLTINDAGTTTFEKNIYSADGNYHGLNILPLGDQDNTIIVKGNIGDAAAQRLGPLVMRARKIETGANGGNIYTAGDIELQKRDSLSYLELSGSFAFDAQDTRNTPAAVKKINAQTTVHNGNLTVNAGEFNIANNYYQMGGASLTAPRTGFWGYSGMLTLSNKARFITQGDFMMTGGALDAEPLSVLEMRKNSGGDRDVAINLDTPAAQRIGSLVIAEKDSATVAAQSDLIVRGDWTQPQNDNPQSSPLRFNPTIKTVTFTGEANGGIVTIKGNTRWYNFKAEGSSLKEIQFSNWSRANDAHTFINSVSVKGTAAKRVKLTSITENPNPYTPQTIPPVPNSKFWVIATGNTAASTFEYVDVYHSFASPNVISVSPVLVNTGKLSPYWTLNWNSDFYYLFAFTEDSTGSGAPDRLRIQPSVNELNSTSHDFSNFKIEVDGYDVIGYSTDGVLNTKSFPSRFIYAHLRPRSDLRPEQRDTPVWRLINAGSIIDNNTKISIGTFPSFTLKAVDTVAPRLLYSLSNPDTGELYLKFSKQTDAMPLSFTVSVPSGSKSFTRSRSVDTGWLYNGSTPVSAKDLISDPRFNDQTSFTGVTSVAPASWPAYPSGLDPVNPCYPKDFSYNIAEVVAVDIFTNPNPASLSAFVPDLAGANGGMKYQSLKGWEGSRRLSDLLPLAQPPALSANSSFWPSFAVNTGVSEGAPNTLINQWDGSKSLFITNDVNTRALSALIELHVADKIPFSLLPPLLLAVDVSREFRQDKTAGNLWLPSIKPSSANAVDIALSFVPSVFGSAQSLSGNVVKLEYVYAITANNIGNKGSIDFIFSVPALQTPLYAVRLDYRARNWYEGLKPFSFSVQELTRQRGGVTIASNVVNPEKNTTTKISYVLTRSGPVTINVFTLDGTIVKTLYRGRRDKGEFFVEWDGRNNAGRAVARGLYFVRVVGPDIDEMRKVMVVK